MQKGPCTRDDVVKKATLVANMVRSIRARHEKRGGLTLANNLTQECVNYLKECRFFLDLNKLPEANKWAVMARNSLTKIGY